MSNIQETKEYFAKNPEHVKNALNEYQHLYKNVGEMLNKHISGIVVDIGSGGTFNYNTSHLKLLIAGDLTTANKERREENIVFVNLDMRSLPLKKKCVNRVIMQHLLHHLADGTFKKTKKNLQAGLREVHSVIRDSGKVIIIEGTVPPFFEFLQRILFGINKYAYDYLFNFPMVFVYSQQTIVDELKNAGFSLETCESIDDGDILPIFGLNLPRKYIPLKHLFMILTKK